MKYYAECHWQGELEECPVHMEYDCDEVERTLNRYAVPECPKCGSTRLEDLGAIKMTRNKQEEK